MQRCGVVRHDELQWRAVLQWGGGRYHPELEHPQPQHRPLRLIWYAPAVIYLHAEMAKVHASFTQVEVQILVFKKYSGKSRSTD